MQRLEPHKDIFLKDLPGEEWKDIPGYEGYYVASSLGRVKSLGRVITRKDGRTMKVSEKIKKQTLMKYNSAPNYGMALSKDGINTSYKVKILIASSFLRNDDIYVFHKDGNICNNRVNNLSYGDNDTLSNQTFSRTKDSKKNKYRGVFLHMKERSKPYSMCIRFDGRTIYENFKDEVEAAKKYDFYIQKFKLNKKGNFI
jgi:hypothetical protein